MALLDRLKEKNPQLFWDGVGRGKIPYSAASSLAMGNGVTSVIGETFVGAPYAPEEGSFDYTSQNPTGVSGAYPKPWLSYSQRNNNATYTYAGAYARMIEFDKEDCSGAECVEGQCCTGDDSDPSKYATGFKGIWGRMGTVLSGTGINERAFMPQEWYNADGPADINTAGFWNEYSSRGDGERWPGKQDWWSNNSKVVITQTVWLCNANGASTGKKVKIQVVHGAPGFDQPTYYRGQFLGAWAAMTASVLTTMAATAALRRW